MLKPLTWEVYDDATLRWWQLRGLLSWLKNLSEEVEIEKNKTSVIVRKPCQTLELLGLQWCLGRRTSWIFEYWWMENKGSCKFVPVKLKLSCGAKLPRISWLSITNTKPETPIFVSLLLLNVLDLKTCYLDCKPNKNLFVGNCWPCLWPGSDHLATFAINMVLGPAPVLMRWPVFLLPGLLLPQGRGEGEVGHNQQSQMCRWPEVLLLVGECSEEPVVTLSAKKTRTALICS